MGAQDMFGSINMVMDTVQKERDTVDISLQSLVNPIREYKEAIKTAVGLPIHV